MNAGTKVMVTMLCLIAATLETSQSHAALEIEPNNTMAQANVLIAGSPMTGQVSSASDKDYFKMSATGAGTISLNIDARPGQYEIGSWKVEIYNSAGVLLSALTCLNCAHVLQAGVGAAGTYYAAVSSSTFLGASSNPYTLTASGDAFTNVASQSTSATYDESTRQLTMPAVVVSGTTFRNVVIRLDSFTLISFD